jgi:hypothetical protein
MTPEPNWQQESLEVLENHTWGNPEAAPTNLVKRCIELSKIPIANFSISDLRLMIGQQFGLTFLIPVALEKLKNDLLAEADYYEGDLLANVLEIDTSFWDKNRSYWIQLDEMIKDRRQELASLKISTQKFDEVRFAT